jgi:hypothetical protein
MSETDPTRRDPQRAPSDRAEGTGGHDPIPLEPSEPSPPAPPSPRPRIDSPGLLDDFDEDADLTSDPEVERIVKGIPIGEPARPADAPTAEPAGPPLSVSPSWRVPAAIGAVLTIAAAVLAVVYAPSVPWAYVLLTLYRAAIHTATGVGAMIIAALLLGRTLGSFEGAAARMFMAVSAFLAVFSFALSLKSGEQTFVRGAAYAGMLLVAAGAYFGALVLWFRLTARDCAVIAACHFGLALFVSLGNMLTGFIGGAGSVQ